jgi:hypothetical protein
MPHVIKKDVIGMQGLARTIARELAGLGFTVTNVDGVAANAVLDDSSRIVLSAGPTIDPKFNNEPWSVVVEGHDLDRWVSLNVVPTPQISDDGKVAKITATAEAGRLSVDNLINRYFVSFDAWGIAEEADYTAVPLTLFISTSDHGFTLHVAADALDNTGKAYSWAVVQRPVLESSMAVPAGPAPLFAVFRAEGSGDPDVLNAKEIQRITVREADIHAAALAVTACSFAPDVAPIINSMQQVSVTVDNNAVVSFPQRINTHRHVYALMLDMLGYTSADIMSSASDVPIAFAGVPQRTYKAMNANGANNRGLRVLFPTD